jgi:hypothetical protein
MKLNAPKRKTWIASVVIGAVGLLAMIVSYFALPVVGIIGSWLVVVALALSLAASVASGL